MIGRPCEGTGSGLLGALVFGAPGWWPLAVVFGVVLALLLAWGYTRSGMPGRTRLLAIALKSAGIAILLVSLLEPLLSGVRARPGANTFLILADDSRSMTLKDASGHPSRREPIDQLADRSTAWLAQLRRDFEVRPYEFDRQLKSLGDEPKLQFDGAASNLVGSIDKLATRYAGQPTAGILLMSDGGATDAASLEALLAARSGSGKGGATLPPVYAVVPDDGSAAPDVAVARVGVAQTNFEDTPVTVTADVVARGYGTRNLSVQLLSESGDVLETQSLKADPNGQPQTARFRIKPQKLGLTFYRVRAAASDEVQQFDAGHSSAEATLANNTRLVTVDRGRGPYRVLYVGGRPNWEFKFLQRALLGDDQMQLVGFIRVAKREPKFSFLGRNGEGFNPLFRGFNPESQDQVEQYDKPVMVRVNPSDPEELRAGFPQSAEELFKYHAIVLDDLEAEFYTQDQLALIRAFVQQRGGGLLMLGGQESFKNGRYDRTPIGDLLPVYSDEVPPSPPGTKYRLDLTREGWLEPWVRLRADEPSERKRVGEMPPFQTVNQVRGIKPGATVLARVSTEGGASVPALVEQRFGRGRVGAMLIGDLWRWGLKRPADTDSDLERAWRQTARWLVSDVPKRLDLAVETPSIDGAGDAPAGGAPSVPATAAGDSVNLVARLADPKYSPLDNATVSFKVTGPDGKTVELPAEPSGQKAGEYHAQYAAKTAGPYRVAASATDADGSDAGQAQTGWASESDAEEFAELPVNLALLNRLADATGGHVVKASQLPKLVADLPTRRAIVTDPYIEPLWHAPWVFAVAILCLAAEWGLRRWRGLP